MSPADDQARLDAAGQELTSDLASRDQAMWEADATSAYAIRLGASNPPFDCNIFSADYRSRLPEHDPVRNRGGNLRKYGTQESLKAMEAAHNACLDVLGVSEAS